MMRILIFGLCLAITVSAFAGEKATFAELDKAQHLFGDKVTAADLKGKVVFLEYWGVRCPPCRASFPSLVALQKKFASSHCCPK